MRHAYPLFWPAQHLPCGGRLVAFRHALQVDAQVGLVGLLLAALHEPVLNARGGPRLVVWDDKRLPRVNLLAVLVLDARLEVGVGRANESVEAAEEDVRRAVNERIPEVLVEELGVGAVAVEGVVASAVPSRPALPHLREAVGGLCNAPRDVGEQHGPREHHRDPLRVLVAQALEVIHLQLRVLHLDRRVDLVPLTHQLAQRRQQCLLHHLLDAKGLEPRCRRMAHRPKVVAHLRAASGSALTPHAGGRTSRRCPWRCHA